jgi:hypothetical protein
MRATAGIKPILFAVMLGLSQPALAHTPASAAPDFELGPIEIEEDAGYFDAIVRFTSPEGVDAAEDVEETLI